MIIYSTVHNMRYLLQQLVSNGTCELSVHFVIQAQRIARTEIISRCVLKCVLSIGGTVASKGSRVVQGLYSTEASL